MNQFWLISFLIFAPLALETILSSILFYRYRHLNPNVLIYEKSATQIAYRLIRDKFQPPIISNHSPVQVRPYPFFIKDDLHGYKMKPGNYEFEFSKSLDQKKYTKMKFNVTILQDGYRSLGKSVDVFDRRILIFGDSYVFGMGVNDEQTFPYLIQQRNPSSRVESRAVGGYSLVNTLIDLKQIGRDLTKNDIVIVGYGDYFDFRNVAAPSRLRDYGDPSDNWNRQSVNDNSVKHPGVKFTSTGSLELFYVPIYCRFAGDYCDQDDPSRKYMSDITSKLFEEIANSTVARLVVLHYSGEKGNAGLSKLSSRIELLSVLPDDFDYDICDNPMGYDAHPGPYWHYAIYRALNGYISSK